MSNTETTRSSESDRIVGVQAILTDVTEHKRAQQRLRKERDRAQRYLDIAGVMLVVIDTEERVGLINQKGCEILGNAEQEILGKNWFDHFLPPRVREHTRAVFHGLMAGQTDRVRIYRGSRPAPKTAGSASLAGTTRS